MLRPRSGMPIELPKAFSWAGTRPESVHNSLVNLLASTYRPADPSHQFFNEAIVPLAAVQLVTLCWAWKPSRHQASRAALEAVWSFRFDRYTGRVFIDARRDPGTQHQLWDVTAERSAPTSINPVVRPAEAQAAVLLTREALGSIQRNEPASMRVPLTPEVLFAYPATTPPAYQYSAVLKRECKAALGREPTHVDLLLFFRGSHRYHDQHVLVPQRYLANELAPYRQHPRTGSWPGTNPDVEWRQQPDGSWSPLIQTPDAVMLDLSPLGKRVVTAAWDTLVRRQLVPIAATQERFHESLLDWATFYHTQVKGKETDPEFLAEVRSHAADFSGQFDDEVLQEMVATAPWPWHVDGLPLVDLVAIGYPAMETLTFHPPGMDLNLFDCRPKWQTRFQVLPVSRGKTVASTTFQGTKPPGRRKLHISQQRETR